MLSTSFQKMPTVNDRRKMTCGPRRTLSNRMVL